jgi:hypothetical protein
MTGRILHDFAIVLVMKSTPKVMDKLDKIAEQILEMEAKT